MEKGSDKKTITVKLSFNQIKYLLEKFRQFQISSPEGEITLDLTAALKKWVDRKIKKGNLPDELIEKIKIG